jgi:putative membrane protein
MSETLPTEDNGVKSAVISILLLSAAAFGFLLWILYFRPASESTNPEALSFLPAMNAALNSLCAICVVSGVVAIKSGYRRLHISLMVTAILLSAVFLISYITYHTIHGDTKFVTEGTIRYAYFGLLISHVLCTIFALPLIISAVFFALTKRFELHKKVVKFTVPLWLYVSVTGVAIYFLLKANS